MICESIKQCEQLIWFRKNVNGGNVWPNISKRICRDDWLIIYLIKKNGFNKLICDTSISHIIPNAFLVAYTYVVKRKHKKDARGKRHHKYTYTIYAHTERRQKMPGSMGVCVCARFIRFTPSEWSSACVSFFSLLDISAYCQPSNICTQSEHKHTHTQTHGHDVWTLNV